MVSPLLTIRRVVVSGKLSCDLKFEQGLNIIHAVPTNNDPMSTNKVGKTGLIELIQHGLGRRQRSRASFHFAPIDEQIDTLWLEIEANGTILTIERSLRSLLAAVQLREGTYSSQIRNRPAETVSVEELSDYLLSALDVPIVSVKTADGNLTPLSFPLLMRAFVLHQDDGFGEVLERMIPESRRTDVIGFLTGITPVRRFTIDDELAAVQTQTQKREAYYQSVQDFLLENGIPSLIEAASRVSTAEQALEQAQHAQRETQLHIRNQDIGHEGQRTGRLDRLRSRLLQIKDEGAQISRTVFALRQEEERLNEVLSSLIVDRDKSERLQTSSTILSSVEFSVCPRCLLDITNEMRQREQLDRCTLCNRPLRATSDSLPRSLPRLDDINAQIDEAEEIIQDVILERQALETRSTENQVAEQMLSISLDRESAVFVSPVVDQLVDQAHRVAQAEAELARARQLLNQAEALEKIRIELTGFRQRLADLESLSQEVRRPQRSRIAALREIYDQILRDIELPEYRTCSIDNLTLMPMINGNQYKHLGAALKGLAVTSYHLAILELSRREDTFFPRMLVIDSPAVGDLNEESQDKLLQYIYKLQQESEQPVASRESSRTAWQIILTTRRVLPDMEPYITEKLSSPNRMLLR
jgi:hypothetical protein